MKKSLITICMFIIVISFISSSVFGSNFPSGGNVATPINKATGEIWGTAMLIIRMLAFAAILFAGLKYMFTAPSGKAEVKKSLGLLALGALIVFGTSIVVEIVVDAANTLL